MTKATTATNKRKSNGIARPIAKHMAPTIHQTTARIPFEFNAAGVTFNGRQELLRRSAARGITACNLQHDPVPGIDENAVSVRVRVDDEFVRIGFVPRHLTDKVKTGDARVIAIDTFRPGSNGSPVWYCKIRAERV